MVIDNRPLRASSRHGDGWFLLMAATLWSLAPSPAWAEWSIGTPIVSYWEGPGSLLSGKEAYGPLDAVAAGQLAAGEFNVVHAATIAEVELAHAHGLRTMLQSPLLNAASLDSGARQSQLDALIDQYKVLPAAYSYHITDEPSASQFAELGRLVAYLRQRDPDHLAYINLLPNTATDEQLGTQGYEAHLREFLSLVRPSLLSYDHYQFQTAIDTPWYLQNLALVSQAAKGAGVPFLNTVQACSYAPAMRVPNADETRFLVYSTLAYGAQGISYYHYASWGPEYGGIVLPGGKTLPLYETLQPLNREFIAIAQACQPLRWIGTYLQGYRKEARPPGTTLLPARGAPFRIRDVSEVDYTIGAPLRGFLLGCFGTDGGKLPEATVALVQNLDYTTERTVHLMGPGALSTFDAAARKWTPQGQDSAALTLAPGGGVLVGLTSQVP
jgi:hypothetical protein